MIKNFPHNMRYEMYSAFGQLNNEINGVQYTHKTTDNE